MFLLPHFRQFKWSSDVASIAKDYDAYFNYTSLLINAESRSTGFQNSTFIDSSSNNLSVTAVNSPTQTSFTPYSPRDWGVHFDGTANQRLNASVNAALNFGTSPFTIECWLFPTEVVGGGSTTIFGQTQSGHNYLISFIDANGKIFTYLNTSGNSYFFQTTVGLRFNKWQHFALVKEGTGINQIKVYIDGLLAGSGTSSAHFTTAGGFSFTIGNYSGGSPSQTFRGYISNFRVIKNQAIYTGDFIPSTSPFTTSSIGSTGSGVASSLTGTVSLLTCQNNRFIDKSSGSVTITPAASPKIVNFNPFSVYRNTSNSVYFGGGVNTNKLTVASNVANAMSNGDFTIEFWFRSQSLADSRVFGNISSTWGANNWVVTHNYSSRSIGLVVYNINPGVNIVASNNQTLSDNSWHHVAITRNLNSWRLFVDGIQHGSTYTSSASLDAGTAVPIIIGNTGINDVGFTGFLSNVRIVKGQALYTGNFTPPAGALTNNTVGTSGVNVAASLAGTVAVLACQNPVVTTENSTSPKTITATGTATGTLYATTDTPFLTATGYNSISYSPRRDGGSIYLNGTNYITCSAPPLTNNYTFECWFYRIAASNSGSTILHAHADSSAGTHILINTSNQLTIDNGTQGQTGFTTFTIYNNQWYHLAVVKNGATTTAYLNGVQAGSNGYTPSANNKLNIGKFQTLPNYEFNGYICDIRLVNGSALYNAPFTPPTSPLTPINNTALLLKTNNASVFDVVCNNLVTINGTVSTNTAFRKFGSKSLYFNGGANDYLNISDNKTITLSSGIPFTLEGWFYPTFASYPNRFVVLFAKRSNAGVSGGLTIDSLTNYQIHLKPNTGEIGFYNNTAETNSPTSMTLNAWNHIVCAYDGANLSLFKNGTRILANVPVTIPPQTSPLIVGNGWPAGTTPFQGYIDDLRITKGINRYAGLSSFTVPTSAYPTQ